MSNLRPFKASHLRAPARAIMSAEMVAAHQRGVSWSELGDEARISRNTARRWGSMDMSEEAQHDRHTQSGKHPLLTPDEETEILRLATEARERHELAEARWTPVTIALISRFWKHAGWPLRRSQARTPQELRSSLPDEADTFQHQVTEYVHEHNMPPENIHIADETGMWNGSVALRTRTNSLTKDSGLQRIGDNQRDTGMVALSAAGGIDSYFLQHRKQVTRKQDGKTVIVQKGISGMGTEQML
jgi:hypothetical protein